MEIGHNVLHGQWDWMNDPVINSATWDWDTASTAEAWKHSHNYIHHTFTNILGKDRTSATRSCGSIPSRNGIRSTCCSRSTTSLLALLFEWGVAVHDLDFEAIRKGEKDCRDATQGAEGDPRQGADPDPARTTSPGR